MTQDDTRSADIQALAVKAMSGNDVALGALHNLLLPALVQHFMERLSKALAGRRAEAEDLASMTLSEALGALRSGRYEQERAAFVTFAYGCARMIWLRHRERTARRTDQPAILLATDLKAAVEGGAIEGSEIAQQASGEDVVTAAVELAEKIEDLRDCLRRQGQPHSLTEQERNLVVDHQHGATFQVLAQRLRCSVSTAHDWYEKALQKISKCMAAKGHR